MYTALLQHRFELPHNNAKYKSFVLYSFGAVLNNFPQIWFSDQWNCFEEQFKAGDLLQSCRCQNSVEGITECLPLLWLEMLDSGLGINQDGDTDQACEWYAGINEYVDIDKNIDID